MKKFYGILSIVLILFIVSICILTSNTSHTLNFLVFQVNLSVGLLVALTVAFSLLASLSLLLSLGLAAKPEENIKMKNKVEEAKLKEEVETGKVKQLEAKIKTLEEALKKVAANM